MTNSRYPPPTREVKRILHKSDIAQGRKGMYSHSACLCAFAVFVGLLLASCHAEPLEMAEKGREAADSIMNGEETDDASTGGVVFDTVWDYTEGEIDLGEGVPEGEVQ